MKRAEELTQLKQDQRDYLLLPHSKTQHTTGFLTGVTRFSLTQKTRAFFLLRRAARGTLDGHSGHCPSTTSSTTSMSATGTPQCAPGRFWMGWPDGVTWCHGPLSGGPFCVFFLQADALLLCLGQERGWLSLRECADRWTVRSVQMGGRAAGCTSPCQFPPFSPPPPPPPVQYEG